MPRSGWRLSREEPLGKAPGNPGLPPRAAVPRPPAASARPTLRQARPPPFAAAGAEGLGLGPALRCPVPRLATPAGGERDSVPRRGLGGRVSLASRGAPLHRPSRKEEQGTAPVSKALVPSCCPTLLLAAGSVRSGAPGLLWGLPSLGTPRSATSYAGACERLGVRRALA